MVHLCNNLFRQPILDSTALNSRNLVVRMATSNFISPLHLLRLNHQSANLHLSILGWRKRNNKVGAFLSIRLELARFRVAAKLTRAFLSEESSEISEVFEVVREFEADRACLVEWGLNRDYVVDFGV